MAGYAALGAGAALATVASGMLGARIVTHTLASRDPNSIQTRITNWVGEQLIGPGEGWGVVRVSSLLGGIGAAIAGGAATARLSPLAALAVGVAVMAFVGVLPQSPYL